MVNYTDKNERYALVRKIAEEGTHESLMERHGIYAKLYQTQAEYYVTAQTGA